MRCRGVFTSLAVVIAAGVLSAQGTIGDPKGAGIDVRDARIIAAKGAERPTALYFTIKNTMKKDQALISVSVESCGRVEIHNTTMENGVARMRPVDSVPLPSGKTVAFTPAGLHVMCINPKMPMTVGADVPVWVVVAPDPSKPTQVAGALIQAHIVPLSETAESSSMPMSEHMMMGH